MQTVSAMARSKSDLLMSAQDVSDSGAARQGLVNLHGRPSRICKYPSDTLPLQCLHQDVCSLARLVPIPVHPFQGPCERVQVVSEQGKLS